ncbi:MAG: ABC transporter permease [Bryobacteraceae bacterium]
MATLAQDIRFALRTFRKSPLFVMVAVVSLALGIGANTAIFSLIDQVLLRLLPVKSPEQLVLLWGRGQHYGSNNGQNKLSYPMYADFRDHNEAFSGMFARWDTEFSLSADGKSERVSGELVSGTYFPVLGVGAALGRVFTPEDDKTVGGHPYVVLSYRYWLTRFGGDRKVVGKKIIVNGFPLTIIGVSQAGFDGLDPTRSQQIRIPLMMKPQMDALGFYTLEGRRGRWVNVFGRLKPGVTLPQAKASLQPFFHQMLNMEVTEKEFAKAAPETKQAFLRMWMDVLPAATGRSGLRQQFSTALLVLMGVVAVVLLIACANVANLLLARATARQKEIAVRIALGASRWRIVSQLLVESLMLSIAGGALGILIAIWMNRALISFMPAGTGTLNISTAPDWRILGFAFAVSVVTGLLFGLIPALQAARPDVAPTLKDQAGAISGGVSGRLRKALVVLQVTLSLLLLIGAGLFLRSLSNLRDLDPGFQTKNLLTFGVDPPLSGYKPAQTKAFYRRLKEGLEALPGVDSASLAIVPVLEGNEWDSTVTVESYKAKPGEYVNPHMNYVSPDYFKSLQVPMLLGRDFRASDEEGASKVAIINERFAKEYFGGTDAIGKRLGMGGDPGTKIDITVVGVVRDSKYEGMRDEVPIELIIPYGQIPFSLGMSVYVRTARDPQAMFGAIRLLISDMDSNLPIIDMKTLESQLENSLLTERLVASLSVAFGILATLLAAIGLYGVMAYSVAQRTREIGIRMALGAMSGNVFWMVIKESLLLVGLGVVTGLGLAWVMTGYVKSQLYGVTPNDPMTIVLSTLGIALVALASAYLPARRAVRIDPIRALRWE